MMIEKGLGVAASVAASSSLGALAQPLPGTTEGLWVIGIGNIPLVPVLVALLSAILVRIVVVTKDPGHLRSYNVALTLLAALGATTYVADNHVSSGTAFWVGSGFGACAVLIIEFAKSKWIALFGESKAKPDTPPKQ